MKRKFVKSLTALLLCACTAVTCLAADITLKIDGSEISSDAAPQIIDGRTMVPLRAIFENIGASVSWDSDTKTITADKDSTTVVMIVGSTTEYVNGKAVAMDVAPQIIDGRTLIPAKYAVEAFGYSVNWDADTKTVNITKGTGSTDGENGLGIDSERFAAVKEVFAYYLNEIENGSSDEVKNYFSEHEKIDSGTDYTKFQECYDNAESELERIFVKYAATLVSCAAIAKYSAMRIGTEEFDEYYQNIVNTAWKLFDVTDINGMMEVLETVNDVIGKMGDRINEILQ